MKRINGLWVINKHGKPAAVGRTREECLSLAIELGLFEGAVIAFWSSGSAA